MRILTAAVLVSGVSDAAMAHVPDGDSVAILSHQLLSSHHLPVLALAALLIAGLLVMAKRAR